MGIVSPLFKDEPFILECLMQIPLQFIKSVRMFGFEEIGPLVTLSWRKRADSTCYFKRKGVSPYIVHDPLYGDDLILITL